jgi:hypothetical protein
MGGTAAGVVGQGSTVVRRATKPLVTGVVHVAPYQRDKNTQQQGQRVFLSKRPQIFQRVPCFQRVSLPQQKFSTLVHFHFHLVSISHVFKHPCQSFGSV